MILTKMLQGETMTSSEKWLSVEEIAEHLGISKETVYRWLETKKIPAHRIGKLWKFQISEINEWVRSGGSTEKVTPKSRGKRQQ